MSHVLARARAVIACAALAMLALCAPRSPLAGESGALPPGSAYEKVSPDDKGDGDVWFHYSTVQASRDGSRLKYQTATAFEGDEGAGLPTDHLAVRTQDGWENRPIMVPFRDVAGVAFDFRLGYQAFTPDLRRGVAAAGGVPLVAGEAEGVRNLYARELDSGTYRLITPPPLVVPSPAASVGLSPAVAAVTDDLRHIAFESDLQLTPSALPAPSFCTEFGVLCVRQAYEWVDGDVRLIGVLPNGDPAPGGSVIGSGAGVGLQTWATKPRAMSSDGSRIVFTTPAGSNSSGAPGELYLREDGTRTTQIDRSQRTVPDPAGDQPSVFLDGSSDLSVIVFKSCEKLTDDSTANAGSGTSCAAEGGMKEDLYRYDVASGQLTDLTASFPTSVGDVVGADPELSRIYFSSDFRIWIWDRGAIKPVTRSPVAVENFATPVTRRQLSTVSPDGRYLVYAADVPQDGIDPRGRDQLFLYDAEDASVTCISCVPANVEVTGDAVLRPLHQGVGTVRNYKQRHIDTESRYVFFESPDALVPEDVNGAYDVYRYEIATGRVVLVSTGTGEYDAHFGDASEDGSAVFFVTRNRVIPELDHDLLNDVYVARAGATQHQAPTTRQPCAGDECQGQLPSLPRDEVPGTASFVGPDDASGQEPSGTARVFAVASITKKQRQRWARSGRLLLTVRVSAPGKVFATVHAKLGKQSRVVARATRQATRGGATRLALRLSSAARRHLRRTGRLRVVIVVQYERGGPRQRIPVTLTLARARARTGSTIQDGGNR